MLKELNRTYITLIPKTKCPGTVSHMPISLCNVSYKIISELLANRLKPVLPKVVSYLQGSFVHGRDIHDNMLAVTKCLTVLQNNEITKALRL